MNPTTTDPTPLIPTTVAQWELYDVTVNGVTAAQVAQVCAQVLEEVLRSVFEGVLAGTIQPGNACDEVCDRWEQAIPPRLMSQLNLSEGFGVLDTEPRTVVYRIATRVFADQSTLR